MKSDGRIFSSQFEMIEYQQLAVIAVIYFNSSAVLL